MRFDLILGVVSIMLIAIASVMMLISYSHLTKGHWKRYVLWLMLSGMLMSVYLLSFVIAKMGIYPQYYSHVLLVGFFAESIAAITFIKSSHALRAMGNKFGFAQNTFLKNLGKNQKI